MKKLFHRDKGKVKLAPSDIGTGAANEGYFAAAAAHLHLHDRSRSSTPTPLEPDGAWALVEGGDTHPYARSVDAPSLPSSGAPSIVSTTQLVPAAPHQAIPQPKPPSQRTSERDRDTQMLRKKAPNGHSAFAAVGILKALDPHLEPAHTPEPSDDGTTETSTREEKKEKRGFWERAAGHRDKDKDKDKDKEREREREKERERERERERDKGRSPEIIVRREDEPAELTRMIGFLTATASEDWSLVLDVCERASASESAAKEAAKAIRREFKYAEPSAQLSAARLWALMLRNTQEVFVHQCASRKFVDTLEDIIGSSRTSPVVRERLLEVLAAAAYAAIPGSKEMAFRQLWRKVKPADKPDEGIPFDTKDAMFSPPTPRQSLSGANAQPPSDLTHSSPQRPPPTVTPQKSKSSSRNRVIPPEEDMRRLFQECKVGKGNAALLSEALAFARPEDLLKEIIKEFYARCRVSQELISAQIPWAFATAEKSRQSAGRAGRPSIDSMRVRTRTDSQVSRTTSETCGELTQEELLLAELLAANEELMGALRQYDDLERVGIEREAEERSRKETRMDRSQLRYEDIDHSYLEPGYPKAGGASTSRSPSPASASPSPAPSFMLHPVVQNPNHPLPPIPTHATAQFAPAISAQVSIQSLAPPPPHPFGPRSPAHSTGRSRTPSPERASTNTSHHQHQPSRGSLESARGTLAQDMGRLRVADTESIAEGEDPPPRPSAKALGKRRVLEPISPDRSFDPDDLFYDHAEETPRRDDDYVDSDSDDGRHRTWHQPVHYVYDAAAERTQQRIREGRLAAAALVGSVH